MKRLLAVLVIAAVFAMGAMGALAVIPHVHGHDVDHSKHASCPVYQAGLHNHAAAQIVFHTAVFFLFLFYLLLFEPVTGSNFSFRFHSLRAPPLSA